MSLYLKPHFPTSVTHGQSWLKMLHRKVYTSHATQTVYMSEEGADTLLSSACLGPEPLLHPVYPGYMAPTVWHLVPTSVIKSTTEYLQCWQEYSKGVYNIHIFLVNEGSSYNDTLQVGFKLLLFKCKTLLLKYSSWNWAGNFFPAGQKVRCRMLEEKSYQGSNPAVNSINYNNNPPGKMHCWNSVMTYGGQVIISDCIENLLHERAV